MYLIYITQFVFFFFFVISVLQRYFVSQYLFVDSNSRVGTKVELGIGLYSDISEQDLQSQTKEKERKGGREGGRGRKREKEI